MACFKAGVPEASVIIRNGSIEPSGDTEVESLLRPSDRFQMEIGAQLIPLMKVKDSVPLDERIGSLRREMALEGGWCFPPLRIRDNCKLDPNGYRILIDGCQVAADEVQLGHYLAISNDKEDDSLEGTETTEPVFGLPAHWIDAEQRRGAELRGYTVVDAPTVIVTHLGEIVRRHAAELLGYEQVRRLLDRVEEETPTVVREIIDGTGAVRTTHYVLRRLLEEGVSLKGLVGILECLGHHKRTISDLEELTGAVRASIGRQICEPYRDDQGRVRAVVFEPKAEQRLTELCNTATDVGTLERLLESLIRRFPPKDEGHKDTSLLVDASIRHRVWRQINRCLPDVRVIAYQEIPTDLLLEPVDMIRLEELEPSETAPDDSPEYSEALTSEEPEAKATELAESHIPRQPR